VFRSWLGERELALDPHEDRGQCEDPKQAGFGIQQTTAHQIVALNICLDNGSDGRLLSRGDLRCHVVRGGGVTTTL
jgi:hypothetical protein